LAGRAPAPGFGSGITQRTHPSSRDFGIVPETLAKGKKVGTTEIFRNLPRHDPQEIREGQLTVGDPRGFNVTFLSLHRESSD